jgi:hypothetical protein
MLYITNAFSLNMLNLGRAATLRVVPVDDPASFIKGEEVTSAVGHADTAAVFTTVLGREVPANRVTVLLNNADDFLLVGQYRGPRLPEGATELPEGAVIEWVTVQLEPTWL